MEKLARERRELWRLKATGAGKKSDDLCDKIFRNILYNMEKDHVDFALGMQQAYKKQYENEFHDDIFEKNDGWHPIWHRNFKRTTTKNL